jgi:hypothetical protein
MATCSRRIPTGLAAKEKDNYMFRKKCPSCGVKLGDFLYADVCPHCHEVLKCNLPGQTPIHARAAKVRSLPVRAFFGIRDFVES